MRKDAVKQVLQTGVILRFPTSNPIELVSALERSLEAASGIDFPLHWSYCIHTLLGNTSSRADNVITGLRARSDDHQIPVGFSGAYHPLLKIDELKKELLWSRENPFNENPKAVFNSLPLKALFPYSVDFRRAPARLAYKGGPTIIVEDRSRDLLYCISEDRYSTLPVIHTPSLDEKRLRKQLLRLYRRESDEKAAILIDGLLTSPAPISETLAVLGDLRARFPGFEIVSVERWLPTRSGESEDIRSIELRPLPIPVDPVTRRFWSSVPTKQKGRKRITNELIKQRLERLSFVGIEEKKGAIGLDSQLRADERTLVADMSGEVLLTESELSARFKQGRIVAIRRDGHEAACPLPARSFLRFEGKTSEFTTISSFSFEGPRARGLRVVQKLDSENLATPGQIVADYYFEEGEEDLLISLTVAYPELKNVDRLEGYALLEWPLFALSSDECVEANCEYPDGEGCTLQVMPQTDSIQLVGCKFHFKVRDTVVRVLFNRLENALPEVLPVGFRRAKGLNVFCINPRGSYSPSPAAAFGGVTEQLHFAVTVGAAETSSGKTSAKNKIPARP